MVGTFPEAKFPDTIQGPSLEAGLPKKEATGLLCWLFSSQFPHSVLCEYSHTPQSLLVTVLKYEEPPFLSTWLFEQPNPLPLSLPVLVGRELYISRLIYKTMFIDWEFFSFPVLTHFHDYISGRICQKRTSNRWNLKMHSLTLKSHILDPNDFCGVHLYIV